MASLPGIRRPLSVVAATCVAAMAVYALGGWWRIGVHFVVNQICMGVSAGKILYALAFMLLFAVRGILMPFEATAGRRSLWAFAVLTAIGLAASMGSLLVYARSLGLDPGAVSFHWRDGVNSVNTATHIHTSKVPIALAIDALGMSELHQKFDTGFAYTHAVPVWLGGCIGACFLGSLVTALWCGPAWCGGAGSIGQRAARTIVIGLSLSALTKSILDGGPLAYDTVIAACAMMVLTRCEAAASTKRAWTAPLLTVAAWLGIVMWISPGGVVHQATEAAARAALYVGIALVPTIGTVGSRRNLARLAAAGCALVWSLYVVADVRRRIMPLLEAAPAHYLAYGRSTTGSTVHTCDALPGTVTANAYVQSHDNPMRARYVSLAPRSGQATGLYADLILVDVPGKSAHFGESPLLTLVRADVVRDEPNQRVPRVRTQIEMNATTGPVLFSDGKADQIAENERFVAYFILDDYMRASGVREYVLLPYMQYRDEAAQATATETK